MTVEEIVSFLEKDIACSEEPYCKTDCDECPYYVDTLTTTEVHKEILNLLNVIKGKV